MFLLLFACVASDDTASPDSASPPAPTGVTQFVPLASGPSGPCMDAALADLDGDGDADVVLAYEGAASIWLENDGSGGLTERALSSAVQDNEDVGIADMNGDGRLDVVLVSEDLGGDNALYLGDGAGGFTDASDWFPVTGTSNAVAITDLNADGRPDLIIGNTGQDVVLINTGTGLTDGTADWLPEDSSATQDLELGDVDGDGDLDVVVGNEDDDALLLREGDAFVFGALPDESSKPHTREADLADLDGDGDLDIVMARVSWSAAESPDRVLLNDGSGGFTEAADALSGGGWTIDIDAADLNGDGLPELLAADVSVSGNALADAPVRVFTNTGGVFTDDSAAWFAAPVEAQTIDLEVGDLNGDGLVDLYVCNRGGADQILVGM